MTKEEFWQKFGKTYEWHCHKCGQSGSFRDVTVCAFLVPCPFCGQENVVSGTKEAREFWEKQAKP